MLDRLVIERKRHVHELVAASEKAPLRGGDHYGAADHLLPAGRCPCRYEILERARIFPRGLHLPYRSRGLGIHRHPAYALLGRLRRGGRQLEPRRQIERESDAIKIVGARIGSQVVDVSLDIERLAVEEIGATAPRCTSVPAVPGPQAQRYPAASGNRPCGSKPPRQRRFHSK